MISHSLGHDEMVWINTSVSFKYALHRQLDVHLVGYLSLIACFQVLIDACPLIDNHKAYSLHRKTNLTNSLLVLDTFDEPESQCLGCVGFLKTIM